MQCICAEVPLVVFYLHDSFNYKTVYISKQNNCAYFGCTIETFYVSVGLRDSKGKITMVRLD